MFYHKNVFMHITIYKQIQKGFIFVMQHVLTDFKTKFPGILVCFLLAVPSYYLGKTFPIVGGPVISIIIGMVIALFIKDQGNARAGIKFTSKIVLQSAIVLLGFGMDLHVIFATGKQSLPIIISTISISLIIAFVFQKIMHISTNRAILVGVGSSICGGSAIAATAPVIDADDNEVAQAISVIFFFNVLAAIFFPLLGHALGFDTTSGEAFGIFAGTAINDTSSVTAAASTWDSMWSLGTQTLNKAVTVKLTRTLAIIPITFGLAFYRKKKAQKNNNTAGKASLRKGFPMFILYFLIAALITTASASLGVAPEVFSPFKELSKFLIVMAMGAIGLNSDIVHLVKTGGKPIILGAFCWIGITSVSLFMQHIMHIW